ncbi:hypothetical protein BJ684DRAFT_4353, partial [Piptocephalis cylindrospora]
LAISPGKALGPFALGASLNHVIALIETSPAQMPTMTLTYDDTSPLDEDIRVEVREIGIVLLFDPKAQRLRTIEVCDFEQLILTYDEAYLRNDKVVPTFVLIYKLFGPTFPGSFDPDALSYELHYPGITFTFPIPQQHAEQYTQPGAVPMEFPDGTTPVCSKFHIYSPLPASAWSSSTASIITPYLYAPLTPMAQKDCCSAWPIRFGETYAQDLITELGQPEGVWTKQEDKMRIHHLESSQEEGQVKDYFYNYFSLGLDLLIDGHTHLCKKAIVHGNFPGHSEFDRYVKCPWSL